eukprot:CAMPEP_0115188432 /NCGR_PEP_ID=MMETSP0270-20121206/11007_1 /TAXON_ID=71861 /ORGANISM="Scrippsiella trochoidea, Strain CCMP3099" /LENGTH=323 /DNA_ID=CAMNT_0002601613 /DNA_START=72 /DNA_END=1040 /DNA_ORIENTATION=-
MTADPAKFNGVWIKDTTDGDMTDFLKFNNVGMLMRQAAWAFGYGKGVSRARNVFADGVMYEEVLVFIDKVGWWFLGGRSTLDGSRQKIAMFEGAPMIPPTMYWVESRLTDTGLESDLFTMGGERHSRAVRSVSEDGNTLTTEITIFDGDKEYKIKTTHNKSTEETETMPALEDLTASCPVVVSVDVPEGSTYKKSVISESLEEYFSSPEQCLDAVVKFFKETQPQGDEKETSLEEVSDTEFIVHITNQDDSKAAKHSKVDRDEGTVTVTYKIGDDAHVDFFFRVHKDPVRVQVSNTFPNEDQILFESYMWAQKVLNGILPRSK